MSHSKISAAAATCVLCALAACSQPAPSAGANAAQTKGQSAAVPPGNACERKLIAAQDVAGLLNEPITGSKNIPGDPQSCEFSTAGFSSVTISVRPGHGMAAVGMYSSGKMDEFEKSAPLAGVGDAAVRSLQLNRIVARKGDLLCEVTGPGMAKSADDPAIRTLGALCTKIFAAY
jgi:hypothetical protein